MHRWEWRTALLIAFLCAGTVNAQEPAKHAAPAPLFRDPAYDGAADPTIVWNRAEKTWWIFYTQRRANQSAEPGVRWCHGTEIGIAESKDQGQTWAYKGVAKGLAFESGQNSFWAPEVFWNETLYHMFVSYVPGMHDDWEGERFIIHYTSDDLLNWKKEGILPLSSKHVIDPCVYRLPDGRWRMWYKDEADGCHIYAADSPDLYAWNVAGPVITDRAGEAPNVFELGGYYWMLTDSGGLNLYRSKDAMKWDYQGPFMQEPGKRPEDGAVAQHPDVLIAKDAAYIFYFVHPFGPRHPEPDKHCSVLQAAKLEAREGQLTALRDEPFDFWLLPQKDDVPPNATSQETGQ